MAQDRAVHLLLQKQMQSHAHGQDLLPKKIQDLGPDQELQRKILVPGPGLDQGLQKDLGQDLLENLAHDHDLVHALVHVLVVVPGVLLNLVKFMSETLILK
eukprot:Awhi_evm1s3496